MWHWPRVETAKAAVEQANEQLGYTVIKAPYSGLVVQRHVQIGEVANPGQPLMTGFSMEKLRINVAVPQQIANHVRRENSAVIYDGVGGSITTKNLTVFPFADAKSNTVTIRAALPEGIKTVFPGMLVKVAFKTGVQKTMVLPSSAVVKRGEVTGVYIVDKNAKMYLQQIRTGRIMGENIEITSGLAAGNIVASDPLKATLVLNPKSKNKMTPEKQGISGAIAAAFVRSEITALLLIAALLASVFAVFCDAVVKKSRRLM